MSHLLGAVYRGPRPRSSCDLPHTSRRRSPRPAATAEKKLRVADRSPYTLRPNQTIGLRSPAGPCGQNRGVFPMTKCRSLVLVLTFVTAAPLVAAGPPVKRAADPETAVYEVSARAAER